MFKNTFITKNNSIVKNSRYNTGRNPVAVLHYGNNSYGRYIFNLDLENLFEDYKNGVITLGDQLQTHVLNLTNTSCYAYDRHSSTYKQYRRAESFGLVLYRVDESFDEGSGYDQGDVIITSGKPKFSTESSNYYQSKNLVPWSVEGVVDTKGINSINIFGESISITQENEFDLTDYQSKILSIQEFPLGNENLSMDITDYVNERLRLMIDAYDIGDSSAYKSVVENSTLCLAFLPQFENSRDEVEHYVGFFSRHSYSAYSPYLQTRSNVVINNDRSSIRKGRINTIFFTNMIDGIPMNSTEKPTVYLVKDPDEPMEYETGNLVHVITPELINNPLPGVYSFDFFGDDLMTECDTLYDVWSGVNSVNGYDVNYTKIDSFSLNEDEYQDYTPYSKNIVVYVSGINEDERINRGVLKTVTVLPRVKFTQSAVDNTSRYFYRLYTKEGNVEIPFTDFIEMDSLEFGKRKFIFNTDSLLPNDYFIDIKIVHGTETVMLKERLKFRVVSISLSSPLEHNNKKGFKPKFI